MKEGPVIKNVFNELHYLHNIGFRNWYLNVLDLAKEYNIDPTSFHYNMSTKKSIKSIVCASFIESWRLELQNTEKNTSLDTYKMIKSNFKKEPYLTQIKKHKYLRAFSRFRAGSHILEIERGRYTNPRTPRAQRLCVNCNQIEDEIHFLIHCKLYESERKALFQKINNIHPCYLNLIDKEKFIFLMTNDDPSILTWVAKFIHESMIKRSELHSKD